LLPLCRPSLGSPPPRTRSPEYRSEWAKDLLAKKLDQIVALYAMDAVFLHTRHGVRPSALSIEETPG
jgi:hypothetical protein